MRDHIGIHVERDALRAVYVSGDHVLAAWSADVMHPATLRSQLDQMFATFPRTSWRRPDVSIVLGPPIGRRKVISGLPSLLDRAELQRLVREIAPRLFIGDPSQFVIVAAPLGDTVIAESYDRQVADMLMSSATAAGCGRVTISSTVAIVGRPAHALAALASFGETYAIAYAATRAGPKVVPALEPSNTRSAPPWRATFAVTALASALLVLMLSPVLAARATAARAAAELRTLAPRYSTAIERQRSLGVAQARLATIAGLASPGRASTTQLEAITRALPRHSALLALTLDSAGGSMVTVSERVTEVLAALEAVPPIGTPQLVGPITREHFGDVERDRATIRFTWSSR